MDSNLRSIVLQILQDLSTPRALTVAILVRAGEWDQIACLKLDPMHYERKQRDKFSRDYRATELLRKAEFLPLGVDRKEEACNSFIASERQCFITNQRLRAVRHNMEHFFTPHPGDVGVYRKIRSMRRFIARVLGEIPEGFESRFGPGAVYESKSWEARQITVLDKIQNGSASTKAALGFLYGYDNDTSLLAMVGCQRVSPIVEIVRGNRFTTVPKSALTERGICIEPGYNVSSQLGVGRYIRNRLLLWGIDLNHGQHSHGVLAKAASLNGNWVTIDLSSASDTVSFELVKLLLPREWFDLLNSLRSPRTLFKGSWHRLEKFSSMGNGFTFELETLIFLAISSAVSEAIVGVDLLVYGDDIIAPTKDSDGIVQALKYFGFTPNLRKTHTKGYFRESCGYDYFDGLRIEPLRIVTEPSQPTDWYALYNRLEQASTFVSNSVFRLILARVPKDMRLWVPRILGDCGFNTDDVQKMTVKVRNDTWYVKARKKQPGKLRREYWYESSQLAATLYGLDLTGDIPTREITGEKFFWTTLHTRCQWTPEQGPLAWQMNSR